MWALRCYFVNSKHLLQGVAHGLCVFEGYGFIRKQGKERRWPALKNVLRKNRMLCLTGTI